jgi:tRNA pseudouridine38-40 synthase
MGHRYRATVEYDGCDYLGFQIQARGRTIQGELEKALERITQESTRVVGAGRTDAGVHALGQVIAFNSRWRHSSKELHRALNAVLPPEIAISELDLVRSEFHPRYDALWRQYQYVIVNQPVRSPLWQRYAHHVAEVLDVEAMQIASRQLVGVHDFAAFGRPMRGEPTQRQVLQAEWSAEDRRLVFTITANAFLYRMVRNIVGSLVRVGRGELAVADMVAMLESRDRAAAGPPAPARGLCLTKVAYVE